MFKKSILVAAVLSAVALSTQAAGTKFDDNAKGEPGTVEYNHQKNWEDIRKNESDIHKILQDNYVQDNRIHTNEQNIGVNKHNIEKNQQAIEQNKVQIDKNTQNIAGNTNDIHKLQQDNYVQDNRIHTNEQNIGVNKHNIEQNKVQIDNNTQTIANNYREMKNNFAAVNSRIDNLDEEMKKGFASQAALNGLFQPYNVGKFNLSVAIGGYESEQAMALGTGYRFNENFAMKAGIASDVGGFDHITYNIGANFEW